MQGFRFIPDDSVMEVPYLEDARADYAPYWTEYNRGATAKKVRDAQQGISQEMAKLGAAPTRFVEGVFQNGQVRRHGIEIHFVYGGARGILRVAGLPMHSETDKKVLATKIQALKIVRDWLKSAVTAKVFSPGNDPLLGYLLLPDGSGRTVSDYIREQNELPATSSNTPFLPK